MAQNEMIWDGAYKFVPPAEAKELAAAGLAQRCAGLSDKDLLPKAHFDAARTAAKKAAPKGKKSDPTKTKAKTENPPLPPGVQAPGDKTYNTRQMKAKNK